MSPGGQSKLLLIRRLLHPSMPGFDPIRGRFFAQVLPKFPRTAWVTMDNPRRGLVRKVVSPDVSPMKSLR